MSARASVQSRRPIEAAGRAIGVGALALALVLSLRGEPSRELGARRVSAAALADSTGAQLANELAPSLLASGQRRATADVTLNERAAARLQLMLTHVPPAALRASLGVAVLADIPMAWQDSSGARGLAMSASAVADPIGGTTVRARTQNGVALLVRDAASSLDSVADGTSGLAVNGARLAGPIEAMHGRSRATLAVPSPASLKRVLLFARPGWEAKFVTAALEERGWAVDARLLIARNAYVTTGTPAMLDSARYAAAVVLDSGVVTFEQLTRFVAQGGGVVLGGDALQGSALRRLQPAVPDGERPMVVGALLSDAPRQGLDAWELRAAPRAVVLAEEAHGSHADPTVVAWRVGSGRVVASAYRATWRWRMEGPTDGADAHRGWWSALVSSVAYVPRVRPDDALTRAPDARWPYPGNAAPYADLVARLGLPTETLGVSRTSAAPAAAWWRAPWVLYLMACVALLVEWTSRRVRGAS